MRTNVRANWKLLKNRTPPALWQTGGVGKGDRASSNVRSHTEPTIEGQLQAWRLPTKEAKMSSFSKHLARLQDESGGVLACRTFRPADVAWLMRDAERGDASAAKILTLLNEFLCRIHAAPSEASALCATCERELRSTRFSAVIVSPMRRPSVGLTFGLCSHCVGGVSAAAVKKKIIAACQQIWPTVRELGPMAPGGRP